MLYAMYIEIILLNNNFALNVRNKSRQFVKTVVIPETAEGVNSASVKAGLIMGNRPLYNCLMSKLNSIKHLNLFITEIP